MRRIDFETGRSLSGWHAPGGSFLNIERCIDEGSQKGPGDDCDNHSVALDGFIFIGRVWWPMLNSVI